MNEEQFNAKLAAAGAILDGIEQRAANATTADEMAKLLDEITNAPDHPDKVWLWGAINSKLNELKQKENPTPEPIQVRTEYHFQPGDVLTFPDEPEAAGRRFVVMRGENRVQRKTGYNLDCNECEICYLGGKMDANPFLGCEFCWDVLNCHDNENPIYFKELKQEEQP